MSKNTGLPERTDPPNSEAPPGDKPEPKRDENKLSPRGWFRKLAPQNETRRELDCRLMEHQVAAKTHGWIEHIHHNGGKPFLLTREDYELALKGANSGLGEKGIHKPACSPERGKGV